MHAWAAGTSWIIDGASWMYVNSHFTITTLTLAFIYLRRNPSFYFIRNMFMVAMGIALVLYAAYPTAPPRFMPEWGFQDSVAQLHRRDVGGLVGRRALQPVRRGAVDARRVRAHARGCRWRTWRAGAAVKALWLLYPLLVTFVVVATANHWWFDAFSGAADGRRRGARGGRCSRAGRPAAWAWTARPPGGRRPAGRLGIPAASHALPAARTRAPPHGARVPGARAQPAHRVAPDAERHLAHRLRPVRRRRRADLTDHYFLGGVAFIVGSVCDTLDGRYSRMSGKGTRFGAFLDSTLDRIEEGIVLTAVAYQFAQAGNDAAVAAVVIAVLASLMVSYTRARAEALGVECKVGIADRAVRVVILSAGLVLAKGASILDVELLEPAVYVLAGLSVITVGQRILHVRKRAHAARAAL